MQGAGGWGQGRHVGQQNFKSPPVTLWQQLMFLFNSPGVGDSEHLLAPSWTLAHVFLPIK